MPPVYQQWRSPAVHAATQLGIADVLCDSSCTVAELAEATGNHAPPLYRLLRALARIGVFVQLDGPRFADSALSQLLRTDESRSVSAMAAMTSGVMCGVWGELAYNMQTGQPGPFDDVGDDADRTAVAQARITRDVVRPKDLVHGPLFRYALIKQGYQRFVWYQVYHHIVIDDAYKYCLVVHQMAHICTIYTALVTGRRRPSDEFNSLQALLDSDRDYCEPEQVDWIKLSPTIPVDQTRGSVADCAYASGVPDELFITVQHRRVNKGSTPPQGNIGLVLRSPQLHYCLLPRKFAMFTSENNSTLSCMV